MESEKSDSQHRSFWFGRRKGRESWAEDGLGGRESRTEFRRT